MSFKLLRKNDKYLILGLVLGTLVIKSLCFFVWQKTVWPNDFLLCLLSVAYYFSIASTCFFSGKIKFVPVILSILFLGEILLLVVTSQFEIYGIAARWILASHYGVIQIISSFENVGQTFPDMLFIGGILLVYVLLVVISMMGKKVLCKTSP